MTNGKKATIVTIIVLAIIGVLTFVFRYTNPGVYFKYKCDNGGDSTRKFYGANWQARGAVCDGYYIPFGTKTNGKSFDAILAKMAQTTPVPANKTDMLKLANASAA